MASFLIALPGYFVNVQHMVLEIFHHCSESCALEFLLSKLQFPMQCVVHGV